MNARDYCFWMQGYCELTRNKPPTHAQWKMIIEHLELLKGVDRSGYGYDDFTEMLQGFIVINGIDKISADQWSSITEKLQDCFEKVTSNLDDEEKSPGIGPEDIAILKDALRKNDEQPYQPSPPYIPQPNPHNPFQDPTQPWITPDIICSDGTNHNPLEGMPISTCSDSKAFCTSVDHDVACNNLEDAYDSHLMDNSMFDDTYFK